MTIEAKLDKLIELTELLVAAGGSAPSKAGRKAKGEVEGKAVAPSVEPVTASTAVEPAVVSAEVKQANVAVGTKEDMKKAVLAYRDATDQATALKLLTDVGAENFGAVKPELYQQVTDSAVAALAAVSKPVVKEVDPFDDGDAPAAPTLVLADVKKAFVARQKEVSEAALLGVLKDLGALGAGAPGQPPTPSLKFLAAEKFAQAIAAVNALPKTK